MNDYTRNQINWGSNPNNAPYAYGQQKEKVKESTIVCRVAVTEEAMGVFSVVETVWAERILVRSEGCLVKEKRYRKRTSFYGEGLGKDNGGLDDNQRATPQRMIELNSNTAQQDIRRVDYYSGNQDKYERIRNPSSSEMKIQVIL